ncbi:MAG: hypothetical protein ABI467_25115 [Kofleriaceae bacterium]
MLERQDIDALLVGALYGELSSTEQAQLTAHLESHPVDRTALDDLKALRERFTTSRIFEVQLEPPQAVSALLLQEAARRAPKLVITADQQDSWFDRFVRAFIAHPAMAAAATLVLVVGVAGTIYLEGGGASQPRVGQHADATAVATAPAAIPLEGAWGSAAMGKAANLDRNAEPAGAAGSRPATKEGVEVGLAEDKLAKTGAAVGPTRERAQGDELGFVDGAKQQAPAKAPTKPAASKARYIEVPKAEPQPKDLEDQQAPSRNDAVAKDERRATGKADDRGEIGGAANTVVTTAGAAPTAPPSPPPPSAADAKPDANLVWAKGQHARILALVKDGKCSAAVPLAATLKTRAPDYYATNVATDRALKSCMQYVNDTSNERAAEKKATKSTDSR